MLVDACSFFGIAIHAGLRNLKSSNIFQKRPWMPFHFPGKDARKWTIFRIFTQN
jgi:hypothetical protein